MHAVCRKQDHIKIRRDKINTCVSENVDHNCNNITASFNLTVKKYNEGIYSLSNTFGHKYINSKPQHSTTNVMKYHCML